MIIQWSLIALQLAQTERTEFHKSLILKEHFTREVNACRDLLESWLMRDVRNEFLRDHQDVTLACNVSALIDELKRSPARVRSASHKNAAPWTSAYPP